MKKILFVIFTIFLLAVPAEAGRNKSDMLPAPILREPGDNVNFKGSEGLLFRWSPEGDRSSLHYYDFRLYRGHQPYESGLILKEQVPATESSIRVSGDQFEAGQTYTWSVRQVGLKKSAQAYSVFKIDSKS